MATIVQILNRRVCLTSPFRFHYLFSIFGDDQWMKDRFFLTNSILAPILLYTEELWDCIEGVTSGQPSVTTSQDQGVYTYVKRLKKSPRKERLQAHTKYDNSTKWFSSCYCLYRWVSLLTIHSVYYICWVAPLRSSKNILFSITKSFFHYLCFKN